MINIRRAAYVLFVIELQLLVWGCSKAPLPTEGNNNPPETEKTSGKLIVSSATYDGQAIDSASVYWDGQFIGYTPLTNDNVPTGVHALRIQKKGFEIYSESVPIANEQPVYVEALLKRLPLNKGQLLITIDQDSATTILSDNKNTIVDLFYTRERAYVLDPGGYFLKTEKPGFQLVFLAFEIKADSIVIKNIRLEKNYHPALPEIALAVPDSGPVNTPILISWESKQAEHVDIDYIENPGLSGKREIVFNLTGMRYIRAAAQNITGSTSVIDSVFIFEPTKLPDIPPTLDFYVTPDSVEYEQSVQVTWNSNGDQVIIDQGMGVRGPSGTEEIIFVNPGTKIFTATAYSVNGSQTTRRDTVFIKEPEEPSLPVIMLATVDSVRVGMPAPIEWHSQNASRVDIDYVPNPGLNGKSEVIFQSAGRRIITATAYNQAGQVSIAETLEVVLIPIQQPQVMPLFVEVMAKVAAVHPTVPQVINNIGPVEIKQQGYYRITAIVWYDSGDYQKNESFFVLINDDFHRKIYPGDPNAGIYKVVPDDPGSSHITSRDAGLFYLSPGKISLEIQHYYTICNQYPQFVVNGPIQDAESVMIIYLKLELSQP